ncbi:MAG: STAS domain-containing protein [Candidatus Omnitrophica bacterium]|nr:STAS domain-containing protein [Candidatus Omnitrophota bacterium]
MGDSIYKVDTEGRVTILALTMGNITMYQNEEFKKAFTVLLDEGKKNIVLDLSDTDFISTIVITSFVFMLKRAKEAGGNLVIYGAKDKVKEVLNITNLDKIFDMFDDRQKAISELAKR